MKTQVLTLSAITLASAAAAAPKKANKNTVPDKPNVLYIMTDQQSWDMISAIGGNKYFSTPNMDRLVKSGFTFTNAYCASPLSMPSRWALLTGTAPAQFNARRNATYPSAKDKIVNYVRENALGSLFQKGGYETYYAGKVHVAFSKTDPKGDMAVYGFDHFLDNNMRDHLSQTGADFFNKKQHKGDKPFLFFVSFIQPHDICADTYLINGGPKKEVNSNSKSGMAEDLERFREKMEACDEKMFLKDETSAPLPANYAQTDNHPMNEVRYIPYSDVEWRKFIWIYHRLVEEADRQIGIILDAFYASPYKDNTIVVFTSDHGDMHGSHRMSKKDIQLQECQRIPFIFTGPGIQNKMDRTTPVCNAWELIPTFCDMMGVEQPTMALGMSLWKYMTKGTPLPERKNLFLEAFNSYEILNEGRYKYVKYELPEKGRSTNNEVLFDLEKDPGELHNCISDQAYQTKLQELRKALDYELQRRDIVFGYDPNPKTKGGKKKGGKNNSDDE